MDKMIYLAMTGAKQTEFAQSINANNLANVSTTGFRADLHAFSPVPVDGAGADSRVNAVIAPYGTDFSKGAVVDTGRELDVAIQGRGFIAVQGTGGREAYTRAGDLQVTSGGILTTGAGDPVMGEGGPVAIPPYSSLVIGADGTISIQPLGQGPETLAIVDRIKLVDPDAKQLAKGSDGLLYLPEGDTAAASANVRLTAGALEHSNVNIARTLVNMIELARRYEMQINVISTAKEDADAAAEMMRIG